MCWGDCSFTPTNQKPCDSKRVRQEGVGGEPSVWQKENEIVRMQTMDGWEWRTGDFLRRNVITTENHPSLKRIIPGWAEWREVGDGAMIAATEHGLQGATKVVQYCCLLRSFFSWNVCSCRLLHLIWTGVWLGQLPEKCSPKISTIGSFSSQKYQADSNSWTRMDTRWQLSFILTRTHWRVFEHLNFPNPTLFIKLTFGRWWSFQTSLASSEERCLCKIGGWKLLESEKNWEYLYRLCFIPPYTCLKSKSSRCFVPPRISG